MKLNCDLGESFGAWQMGLDEQVMPYIDMANIACGFHASDPSVMAKTVQMAIAQNVSIGAHPGYPDLQGFGRRQMSFSAQEIEDMVVYQIGALQAICRTQGGSVDYVKPHGALYHAMMADKVVRGAIFQALANLAETGENTLPLLVLANGQAEELQQQAEQFSVPILFEAFADRAYTDNGNLVSRQQPGAVLQNDDMIEQQVNDLIRRQQVISINGKVVNVVADTICVHGDNAKALASVKQIRQIITGLCK